MEAEFPKTECMDASGTVDSVKFDYDWAQNGPKLIRDWPKKEAGPFFWSKSKSNGQSLTGQRSKVTWRVDPVMRWKAGPKKCQGVTS